MASKTVCYSLDWGLDSGHVSACDFFLSRSNIPRPADRSLCRRLAAYHSKTFHIHYAGQPLAFNNTGCGRYFVCRVANTSDLLVARRRNVSRAGDWCNAWTRVLVGSGDGYACSHQALLGTVGSVGQDSSTRFCEAYYFDDNEASANALAELAFENATRPIINGRGCRKI